MEFKRMSVEEIKQNLIDKLKSSFGCDITDATDEQIYKAVALTVRDEIMQRRAQSRGVRKATGSKKVYYLSAEFLVGRSLFSNMVNLVNEKNYKQALAELGLDQGRRPEAGPVIPPPLPENQTNGKICPSRADCKICRKQISSVDRGLAPVH